MTVDIEKSKAEANIHAVHSLKHLKPDDIASEQKSDLNIISHLNHHTLLIHKPLSPIELRNLLYFIRETDAIATLQFLP